MSDKTNVIGDFMDILSCYNETDTRTRRYGTNEEIYKLEIHVISVIAKNPGIHVIGIAEDMGITKGSVSEVLKKLEKKGLIVKEQDDNNRSRLALYLTDKGKKAAEMHNRFHEEFNYETDKLLKNISDEDQQKISEFLKNMDSIFKKIDKKYK